MPGVEGMAKRAPMHGEQARQRMWQSMRVLRRFSAADLVSTAEVGLAHAQKYCRMLVAAGYLRIVQPKREGVAGGHAIFALLRDTGPHAPRMTNEGVRDPNTQPHALTPAERPVNLPRAEYERALRCVRACAGMDDPEAEVAQLRNLAMGVRHD